MSYRCGMGYGMARLGFEEGPPHIRCDDCGTRLNATTRSGGQPAWLLNSKAPKGWLLIRQDDHTRIDYCPACRAKHAQPRPSADGGRE